MGIDPLSPLQFRPTLELEILYICQYKYHADGISERKRTRLCTTFPLCLPASSINKAIAMS
jgi:hypothetical protein